MNEESWHALGDLFELSRTEMPLEFGECIPCNAPPRQSFKHTEESKLLMSEHRSGIDPWNLRVTGYTTSWKGRTHTQETKDKIRVARGTKGTRFGPHTDETKQKCRDNHPRCKPVVLEGVSYPSISAAARDLGVSNRTITNRLTR